jgi:hypothetical protein
MIRSKRYLTLDSFIMILPVLLAIVGIGMTAFAPLFSHWYWLAMVVITGIACTVMEWSRAREIRFWHSGYSKGIGRSTYRTFSSEACFRDKRTFPRAFGYLPGPLLPLTGVKCVARGPLRRGKAGVFLLPAALRA